jgi:hypothetical protein
VLIGFAHDLRALIPYLLAVTASIEEMFFGFLLLVAEHTEGWPNEASFPEIIPG